jgi:hypothetical protein
MCIDEKNYAVISQTVDLIGKEAQSDRSIFAFYDNPIYYFLTQKNNPTRYIDFNVPVGEKEEQKVINELQQNKTYIIITRFPIPNSQSKIISNFIEKNYIQIKSAYEFTVWKYRK